MQYQGWNILYSIGVALDGNPGGSFFYVISGIHAAHVIGGVFALTVAMLHAFTLKYKPTEKEEGDFNWCSIIGISLISFGSISFYFF